MEESWSETIDVDGALFEVFFLRRPFREGLEVRVSVDGETVSFGELGFGHTEVRLRAVEEIRTLMRERRKER